jgi:hypothetical protein
MVELPINNPIETKPAAPQASNETAKAPPNIPPTETHVPSGIEDQPHPENTNHEIREWWKVAVETLTFFAVVWYACIARGQLTEMHDATVAAQQGAAAAASAAGTADATLKASKESFRIEQRPYITVSKLDQGTPLQSGESNISLGIHNSGRTPALKIKIFPNVFIGKKRLDVNFTRHSESVLASDKEIVNTYTLSLTETDAKLVVSDTDFLFKGTIRYTDIFKEWHSTTFCARYFPKEQKYKYCETGNEVE